VCVSLCVFMWGTERGTGMDGNLEELTDTHATHIWRTLVHTHTHIL